MHLINKLFDLYPRRLQKNTAQLYEQGAITKYRSRVQYWGLWLIWASLVAPVVVEARPCGSAVVDVSREGCACFDTGGPVSEIFASIALNQFTASTAALVCTPDGSICDNILVIPDPSTGINVFRNTTENANPGDFYHCTWTNGVGFSDPMLGLPSASPEPPILPFPADIPTTSTWGLVVLIGLLGAAIPFANRIRRRKQKLNG